MTNYFRCKSTPVNFSIVHILKKTMRHDNVLEINRESLKHEILLCWFGPVNISGPTPHYLQQ